MNVYDGFFRDMNPEAWEFFAIDFLSSMGFVILRFPSRGADAGMDGLVSFDEKIFLVSCKHYIESGSSVGVDDEKSILDRIIQHRAEGFIGFYSTLPSSSLEARFSDLSERGYDCIYYDKNKICDFLPKISSQVLQKYGIPNGFKYVLNVPDCQYHPLPCLGCKVDILSENMIASSMALVLLNDNNQLEYLYGCKRCLASFNDRGWVCVYQAIHQEELNGWINYIRDDMEKFDLAPTFYQHKSEFEAAVQQRMFPSNWGRWFNS